MSIERTPEDATKGIVDVSDLFAFWRYDLFPFWLGGTVVRMSENGSVETKEFGKGYWFKPYFIVPVSKGRMLKEKLDALRAEHHAATKTFNDEWAAKVRATMESVALLKEEK